MPGLLVPLGTCEESVASAIRKKTPGIVPCAARLVGRLLACTVLLPVSVSGQGIGGRPNFCAVLGPRAVRVGDCDGDNDCEADQMCRD